jgi:hypothetical protein
MISSHAPVKIRLITVSQSQAGASADQQQKAQDSDQEDRHEGDLQDRKDRSSNPTTADKQTSPECYTWRRQDRIDKGIEPGQTSSEKAELTAAKRRITELETELAIHRRASELLGKVVPPKGGSRPSR